MKTLDRILIMMGVFLLIYTVVDLVIFAYTSNEPSTLTACIFAACTGEAGICGWIKNEKTRLEDRQWVKEDRHEHEI